MKKIKDWKSIKYNKNLLPEQKILAFKGKIPSQADKQNIKARDLIRGFAKKEKEVKKLAAITMAPSPPIVMKTPNFTDGKLFLKKSKQLTIAEAGPDDFFNQPEVVYHFGYVSKMKMRLGFDPANEVYRVYMRRDYTGGRNPSIIDTLLDELPDVIKYLEQQIELVQESIKKKLSIYKDECLVNGEAVQVTDPDFWESPSVFRTNSENLRCRMTWNYGDIYRLTWNNKRSSSEWDDYIGPKCTFTIGEVRQLAELLSGIQELAQNGFDNE